MDSLFLFLITRVVPFNGVLGGISEHLFGVKARSRLQLSLFDGFAGGFQKAALFKLELPFDLFALDVRNEERRDEIFDDDLWLIALLLNLVQKLVDRLNLQLGFLVGLQR